MERERWQQLEELYHAALEIEPTRRAEFLRARCNGDQSLCSAVESLLEVPASVDSVFDHPAFKVAAKLLAGEARAGKRDPLIGITVANFKILEKIDEGGMGVIYKALDLTLQRQVALKFLPEILAHDPAALERLRREARAASALNHANICTIHEIREEHGKAFIVMELMEGMSLRERIAKGTLKIAEIVVLGTDVAQGLAAAHAKGIIHRDIKPANIFVTTDGRAKLLDFGLAKVLSGKMKAAAAAEATVDVDLTTPGAIVGTFAYMSPEQARGEELDVRTDIFSFGATLYEMATGAGAFRGKSLAELHDAILNRQPRPAAEINPEVPPQLQAIVAKALVKGRHLRYQSAAEIIADLELLEGGTESGTKPATTNKRREENQRTALRVALALVLLAAVAVGAYFLVNKPPKLTAKDTIVLADLDNKTGDSVFDDSLKQALAVALEQSPFLNILPDQTVRSVLPMMGHKADDHVAGQVAREICERLGSTMVLNTSIVPLGNRYLITLQAANCMTGELIAQESGEAATKSEVLHTLGTALSKLRKRLGESRDSIQRFNTPIEEATTNSLEALKAYTLGWKLVKEQGNGAAVPFYKRAIELDPNFAMAYARLGIIYYSLGESTLGEEMTRKAYELRDRVTENEKLYLIPHFYEVVEGNLPQADQHLQVWKETYPRDVLQFGAMEDIYMAQGEYEKAVAEAHEAMRRDPQSLRLRVTYFNLASSYIALGRLDDAEKTIRQAQENGMSQNVNVLSAEYMVAFLRGDSLKMERLLQSVAVRQGGEEHYFSLLHSDTLAYSGQLASARELLRGAVQTAMRNGQKETAEGWQLRAALNEAEVGNFATARQQAAAALELWPRGGRTAESMTALVLARSGDVVRARNMANMLAKAYPADTLVNFYWIPSIKAAIALHANNHALAVEQLALSEPFELGTQPVPMYPAYLRGEAYLAANQPDKAAAEFQKFVNHRGVVLNSLLGSLAHLQLGRAYALSRDNAKAKAAYDDFLTLWKDADPDTPILKKAKAEYAKFE